MLIKLGVDISKLNRECRRALNKVVKVYTKLGLDEPVITSTYDGNHSAGSLHYCNDAFDLRLPTHVVQMVNDLLIKLKETLGKDYDVILEKTHIHVEYDPE